MSPFSYVVYNIGLLQQIGRHIYGRFYPNVSSGLVATYLIIYKQEGIVNKISLSGITCGVTFTIEFPGTQVGTVKPRSAADVFGCLRQRYALV